MAPRSLHDHGETYYIYFLQQVIVSGLMHSSALGQQGPAININLRIMDDHALTSRIIAHVAITVMTIMSHSVVSVAS